MCWSCGVSMLNADQAKAELKQSFGVEYIGAWLVHSYCFKYLQASLT